MRFFKTAIPFALLALAMPAKAASDQTWLKAAAEVKPFEAAGRSVRVEDELRYGGGRLVGEELVMTCGYRFTPWLSANVGHWIARDRPVKGGHLQTVQRPLFDLSLAAPEFWTLKFDFRTRFELCDHHHQSPFIRYRERLRLRTSWSATRFEISPYCYEEVFLTGRPHRDSIFDRNRFQAGLSFRPMPSVAGLSCNLYYMAQHVRASHPARLRLDNIAGLELVYSF